MKKNVKNEDFNDDFWCISHDLRNFAMSKDNNQVATSQSRTDKTS